MLKSGFQYISCYCLSCPKIVGDNVDLSFQYISCYCLSSVIQVDRFHASSFQYISCYCLSYLRHVYSHLSLNFNTSHVTVYRYHSTSFFFATFISIHLMLLFITLVAKQDCLKKNFNTSHVTVYPGHQQDKLRSCFHFNTSHVTVYRVPADARLVAMFNFNTSHVTVYLTS